MIKTSNWNWQEKICTILLLRILNCLATKNYLTYLILLWTDQSQKYPFQSRIKQNFFDWRHGVALTFSDLIWSPYMQTPAPNHLLRVGTKQVSGIKLW